MKKNQGISLISLIITIIVIIILAAIVIFNGFGTADSANFASFTQRVDNVHSAVMNEYAELFQDYGVRGIPTSKSKIYYEVAVGDSGEGAKSIADKEAEAIVEAGETKLGITLPDGTWYVTNEGEVFVIPGFEYDGKTYYNGSVYSKTAKTDSDKNTIAAAIAAGKTDVDAK